MLVIDDNWEVGGISHAMRGMRNPKDSWDKSDSEWVNANGCDADFVIGDADMELAQKLNAGGSVHAKYRRFIVCWADITAPLYWWKEFDTYRMGVEKNSCSTMHKIQSKEFTKDMFSTDHLNDLNPHLGIISGNLLQALINHLNKCREKFLETKDKAYWWQMIQLLPSSWNQKRTVMMSYEALANMYYWRKNHKLNEWRDFCAWVESLPYSEIITGGGYDE